MQNKLEEKNIINQQEYCADTIQFYRESMVGIAERLWNIRSEEKWRGRWSSWEEFLEEMGMKKGTASKLCTLYKRIVIELGFPKETLREAPWTNLYIALPMMKDKAQAEKAILRASTLTGPELYEERWEYGNGGQSCPHAHSNLLRHCLDCKVYMKVYEQETGSRT